MIEFKTEIRVPGMSGKEVYDFLLNADDIAYQRWWPGTHLHYHTVKKCRNEIGSIVFMDEFIGRHRVRMKGVIVEAEPGKRITLQMLKLIRLPVRLFLNFDDRNDGVTVTHIVRAGFGGIGRVLDPFFRLHFSKRFEKDLDQHVRTEFPRLRDLLLSDLMDTNSIRHLMSGLHAPD